MKADLYLRNTPDTLCGGHMEYKIVHMDIYEYHKELEREVIYKI